MRQRTIDQRAVLAGSLGAITIGIFPPLGIALLIAGFLLQRSYTRGRHRISEAAYARALERQERELILAVKSLPR